MVFSLPAVLGGMIGLRATYTAAGTIAAPSFQHFTAAGFKSPLIQGGGFGVGYTSGAYGGYGVTNTWDPLGIHKKSYKPGRKQSLGIMPYGYRRYYGRRRYYRRRRPYYRRYRRY